MEKLYEILEDVRPDVDFKSEKNLVDGGILDSFDVVTMVGDINEEFGVEITALHLVPENFNSAEAIWALIQSLK